MPDGNIGAAKTRLVRAVARLCDPRTTLIGNNLHTAPSLYHALKAEWLVIHRGGESEFWMSKLTGYLAAARPELSPAAYSRSCASVV